MKKRSLIIAGVLLLVVAVIVILYRMKKKETETNETNVIAAPPAHSISTSIWPPAGTDEFKIASTMNWYKNNALAVVTATKNDIGFTSTNQAAAYLSIMDNKNSGNPDRRLSDGYAGETVSQITAWVKKYVQ